MGRCLPAEQRRSAGSMPITVGALLTPLPGGRSLGSDQGDTVARCCVRADAVIVQEDQAEPLGVACGAPKLVEPLRNAAERHLSVPSEARVARIHAVVPSDHGPGRRALLATLPGRVRRSAHVARSPLAVRMLVQTGGASSVSTASPKNTSFGRSPGESPPASASSRSSRRLMLVKLMVLCPPHCQPRNTWNGGPGKYPFIASHLA